MTTTDTKEYIKVGLNPTPKIEEDALSNTPTVMEEASAPPLPKESKKTIEDFLMANKSKIEAALPKHLTGEKMLRLILTELNKNPDLKECTLTSLVGSILQCSQLGLEPGATLGNAYLIPFNRKVKEKDGSFKTVKECQFMIGYRGMLELARRSGKVLSFAVRPVYENDVFEFSYGLVEKCHHIPTLGDKGEFLGAYANIKLRDDSSYFEFMSKADINKIRDSSIAYSSWLKYGKSGKKPIWEDNYEEMAKKTVVRHVFKYLPISIEIQSAVSFDEQVDHAKQNNSFIFDNETGEITGNNKTRTGLLANKLPEK